MAKQTIRYLEVEGDLPTSEERDVLTHLSYVNPDPDGNGIAYNGLPVYTAEQAAANLNRGGARWNITGSNTITYTFLDHEPGGLYKNPHYNALLGAYVEGFTPFTADQREAAREAIGLWDDLIAPSFREINGRGADIVFVNTNTGPAQASAFTPFYGGGHGQLHKIQGDIFVNQDQPDNFDLFYGGYGQTALTHEIGHAIGLEHTGDYNYSDDENGDGQPDPITYANDAYYFQDSMQYSIMSYFHSGNTGTKGFVNWLTGGYAQTPQTPMLHDIAAVQAMYGADLTTRTGNTTYGFNSNAGRDVYDFTVNINPYLTIYDAGGHDTLDLSGWTRASVLDLREGGFSSGFGEVLDAAEIASLNQMYGVPASAGTAAFWNAVFEGRTSNPGFLSDNIAIAHGTVIEDGRTGSGNDTLIGNDVANWLDGGAGGDVYTGGGGADIFAVSQVGWIERITDFVSGTDKIDLSGIDTDPNAAGDQGFTFVGNGAFTGGDQVRVFTSNGTTFVEGDINGDMVADFRINLGTATVVQNDILV